METINPHNVLQILSNLTTNQLFYRSTSSVTVQEKEIASNLYECLNSIIQSDGHWFESEITLDHDDQIDDQIDDQSLEAGHIETDQEDSYEPIDEHKLQNHFSLDYMKRVVEFFDEINPSTGKRRRKWTTVKRRFRRVPNPQCIARFRTYIESGGSKRQKLEIIDTYVYDRFEDARYQYLSVHDLDLRRWALQKARELDWADFQASYHWILEFKHRHAICSRRVTKLVTKRFVESQEEIGQSAEDFVSMSKKIIKRYRPDQVLNTDQIGIELEPHGNRTLSHSGEKSTWAAVRSTGAASHSYTIQPIITMDGSVIDKLYVCLKEPTGRIGENVKKNLFDAKNIVLTCSKSGKLSSSLVKYWRDQCLIPNLRTQTLLFVDSLPHQIDPNIYKELKNFQYRVIPPKTTATTQPLDVYYNRQHKKIVRRIYDHVRLDRIDINLSERNNLIKLQSLVHSQMCSKVFRPMVQYAWFKSGLTEHDPGPFQNVKDICFTFQHDECCVTNCFNGPMIRCSWCSKELCFNHFFRQYHYH